MLDLNAIVSTYLQMSDSFILVKEKLLKKKKTKRKCQAIFPTNSSQILWRSRNMQRIVKINDSYSFV